MKDLMWLLFDLVGSRKNFVSVVVLDIRRLGKTSPVFSFSVTLSTNTLPRLGRIRGVKGSSRRRYAPLTPQIPSEEGESVESGRLIL